MKYVLDVHPRVIKEAAIIYAYREGEKKGSGDRFIDALVDCYARITANPYGCQIRFGEFRHVMLHRLRYRLVYRVEGTVVYVVQVRHTNRKPSKKFGP
ncbi:MAG: type II toxin-antitoxin system RelE/ParE family toxin [Bacteroidetes bacterium]|nr:type II toxin-antitoxin system RelE/ParE family toxin [Bacteroidota bacterium]